MLDVPEHPAEKQAGQRRAGKLDDDVAGDPLPREVPAQREGQRHRGVQVRAGDRAHEQDDRRHHQARRDNRRGQADLPLRVQKPATRGGQHQREGAQQLREQPPPFLARVIEVRTVPELKGEQVVRARERRAQRRRVRLLGRRAARGGRLRHGPALARTVRRAHRHVVRHAPLLPVNSTEGASPSRRHARASSSPAPPRRPRDAARADPRRPRTAAMSVLRSSLIPGCLLDLHRCFRSAPQARDQGPRRGAGPGRRAPAGRVIRPRLRRIEPCDAGEPGEIRIRRDDGEAVLNSERRQMRILMPTSAWMGLLSLPLLTGSAVASPR